jgi:hypothetical protein
MLTPAAEPLEEQLKEPKERRPRHASIQKYGWAHEDALAAKRNPLRRAIDVLGLGNHIRMPKQAFCWLR